MMLDSQIEHADQMAGGTAVQLSDPTNGQANAQAGQRPLTASEVQFAITFTRIVSVLSRSLPYRNMPLGALERLVVPMIMTGQFAIMDAEVNGHQAPIALAFWATVSPEVDQRLSENLSAPVRLRTDEWRSGDILWLVDAVGDRNAIHHLLATLHETAFAGRQVKVRTLGPDARPVVRELSANCPPAANGAAAA